MENITEENPQTKALIYLREVMRDDEKFTRLNNGEAIEVIGSEGGKYILYPNGHVVRLDSDAPKLGKLLHNSSMPYPDVLCTVYSWITKDEQRFLKNWGCGNISIVNAGSEANEENLTEEERVALREIENARQREIEEYEPHYRISFIAPIIALIVMLPVGWLIISNIQPAMLEILGNSSSVATNSTTINAKQWFENISPLILIAPLPLFFYFLLRLLRRGYDWD